MHNASKVQLGVPLSSDSLVEQFNVDPATFLAGLCVSMASTGKPQLAINSGLRMGVSLGRSQSDHKKTAILRAGLKVPIRASLKRSTGTVTISSVANLLSGTPDSITVGATIFTAQAGAATPGDATFRAATGVNETAASLAAQINAHATASTLVYAVASAAIVTLYAIVEGAGTGHDVALAYTNGDGNVGASVSVAALAGGSNTISDIAYIAIGAKAYINNATGKLDIAMSGFSTLSDGVYQSLEMDGIDEDGATVAAALVDMPGGL